MTTFSVIIPTYRRPEALAKCLSGLEFQTRPANEVIVVTRSNDLASQLIAKEAAVSARIVFVDATGVLAAMTKGFLASTSDWVAFSDDDAVASPTWLFDLEQLAKTSGAVGVGGRDVLEDEGVPRPTTLTTDVGKIGAFGRFVGNHHSGTGGVRSVSMLKGVNCAYDASLLGIPTGLYGQGAQAHFEIAIGLDLAKHGTLLYDPSVTVRHAPGGRLDSDQRVAPSRRSIADVASNAVLCCGVRSWSLAARRALFSLTIGDASCPGVARFVIGLANAELRRRFLPSLFGSVRGLLRVMTRNGVAFFRR